METESIQPEITVYPNPVRDVLNIHVPEANEYVTEIRILDLQGRIIYSELTSTQTTAINAQMLGAENVFIVRIVNEKRSTIFKVIKAT